MLIPYEQLPARLTRFIGRSSEKAELGRLLETARLITITGPGGVGKTRLALEVARESGGLFPDGAAFVDFSRTADDGSVAGTLAECLDVPESPGTPIEDSIVEAVRDLRALLVLDNCEHVLEGVIRLVPLMLSRCPAVAIVATSRQPLGVEGEVVLRLQGLALPEDGSPEQAEAMQLFLDRARLASPGSRWQAQDLAAAALVCREVEGIPLALELAAAHANAIPLAELAARLSDSMALLGRPGAAPSRHETLWTTMEWSYRLLSPEEAALLRALSVFRGGATVEAVEDVCGGGPFPRSAAGRVLLSLSEKSLVLPVQTDRGTRYRLLEPVRQYASERLEELGEADAVSARHAAFFAALAASFEELLRDRRQTETVWRLEAEHDNLRRALSYSLSPAGNVDVAARIAGSLGRFWLIRGHFTEALGWAKACIALLPRAHPLAGRVFKTAGVIATALGYYRESIAFMQRSVESEKAAGDDRWLAEALMCLGHAYEVADQPKEARAAAEAAAGLMSPDDIWLVAQTYRINAHAEKIETGDLACVEALHEKEYAAARQTGDDLMIANVLNCLAECSRWRGDYARARVMYGESLGRRLALGDRFGAIQSYLNMGLAAIEEDDLPAAEKSLAQALRISLQIGNHRNSRIVLAGFAGIAAGRKDWPLAARFLGASVADRPNGRLQDVTDQRVYDLLAGRCRRELGEDVFDVEHRAGQVLSLDAAIAEARRLMSALEAVATPVADAGTLTAREREILRLLASGLSNRAIADRLVLSVRTVETHVAHVFEKLDVATRVQAAAYAIEHGLVEASAVAALW